MRRAFTLIEVIVVMGIVGVLIGLSIPALGAARREMQRVECMTNLRSLYQGLRMYMDTENQGIFPAAPGYNPHDRNQGFTRIFGVIEAYLDAPQPRQDPDNDQMQGPPFVCPADDTLAWEFGYSYDYYIGGVVTSILNPNQVLPNRARPVTMSYDMGRVAWFDYVWLDAEGWHPNGPGRHLLYNGMKGRNAAFYDGSVDWAVRPWLDYSPN